MDKQPCEHCHNIAQNKRRFALREAARGYSPSLQTWYEQADRMEAIVANGGHLLNCPSFRTSDE